MVMDNTILKIILINQETIHQTMSQISSPTQTKLLTFDNLIKLMFALATAVGCYTSIVTKMDVQTKQLEKIEASQEAQAKDHVLQYKSMEMQIQAVQIQISTLKQRLDDRENPNMRTVR